MESRIGAILAAVGEPAPRRIDIGRLARIGIARADGGEVDGPFGKGADREGREIAMAEVAVRAEPAFGIVEREGGLDRDAGVAKVEDAHCGFAAMKEEGERAFARPQPAPQTGRPKNGRAPCRERVSESG